MTDPQRDTTTLVVLGLVALQPGSGYDLARLADRSVGYLWTPSRSQIYKILPRLVSDGWPPRRESVNGTAPTRTSTRSPRRDGGYFAAGCPRPRKNPSATPISSRSSCSSATWLRRARRRPNSTPTAGSSRRG